MKKEQKIRLGKKKLAKYVDENNAEVGLCQNDFNPFSKPTIFMRNHI